MQTGAEVPVPVPLRREPVPGSQLDFPGQPYSVSVLSVGYSVPHTAGTFRADGTVTLITGPRRILVDTGGPWARARDGLLAALRARGLEPADLDLVVGTHGHSDHVGNLNLFSEALIVVGYDVSKGDTYQPNKLSEGEPYRVDDYVSIIPSPGHSGQDVSLQVKGTSVGTVLVAGDLFENVTDEETWRELSLNPDLQELKRQQALSSSDVIIPGHGPPFRVLRS